jgi:hypothetical protein
MIDVLMPAYEHYEGPKITFEISNPAHVLNKIMFYLDKRVSDWDIIEDDEDDTPKFARVEYIDLEEINSIQLKLLDNFLINDDRNRTEWLALFKMFINKIHSEDLYYIIGCELDNMESRIDDMKYEISVETDEEIIKVSNINFDPGFTGHSPTEERTGGIKLGIMVYLSDESPDIHEYRRIEEKLQIIPLKKLILDPESIYQDLVLQRVDPLNKMLFTLKNQLHIKKKQYIQLKKLLSGGQTIKVYKSATSSESVDIPFESFGPFPNLAIDFDKNGHVETQLTPLITMGEFGFNVYVPSDLYYQMVQTNTAYHDFKEMVQESIKDKLSAIGIKMFFTTYVKLNIIEK